MLDSLRSLPQTAMGGAIEALTEVGRYGYFYCLWSNSLFLMGSVLVPALCSLPLLQRLLFRSRPAQISARQVLLLFFFCTLVVRVPAGASTAAADRIHLQVLIAPLHVLGHKIFWAPVV